MSNTNLHKITLYCIGLNDKSQYNFHDVLEEINNVDDLCLFCYEGETKDIGEWSDEHRLNQSDVLKKDFDKYFEKGDL